jgi:hypothetical protein
MDGYGAVAYGSENRVVRASRALAPDLDTTAVGPVRYQVIEPLRSVRFVLEASQYQPIAFDVVFEGRVPPSLENKDQSRSPSGSRVMADLTRYHQIGVASGWVEVDGRRTPIDPDGWVSTRDHSWGVRYHVGAPLVDAEPPIELEQVEGLAWRFGWSPALMTDAAGEPYGIHHFFQELSAFGFEQRKLSGGVESPDGSVARFAALRPELRYDPVTRRLTGGVLHFTMEDGSARPVEIETAGPAGVQLGLGHYFGLDGHWHGEWRGPLHVEGEHVVDVTDPAVLRRIHQARDNVMRFHDPVGGGEGVGNYQSAIVGDWPDLGLGPDSNFM